MPPGIKAQRAVKKPKSAPSEQSQSSSSVLKEGYCFTRDDLKYLQSLSLQEKVQKTQAKILEWARHWNWNVYVSFSGGKDSTVLWDMARRVGKSFRKKIPGVFIDTGLEYPEIREFVRSFGEEIIWLKPEKTFKQVVEEHGYPVISKDISGAVCGARRGAASSVRKLEGLSTAGLPDDYIARRYAKYKYLLDAPFKISDYCCMELKKKPAQKFEKETDRKCITGMMAYESIRRRVAYLRHGCNAFDSARPISHPMGFWKEQDVLEYLSTFDIPYVSLYGEIVRDPKSGKLRTTMLDRTGCVFCMFGVQNEKHPNRFQLLKETHPKLYRYCMGPLGCRKVLDYIKTEY